MATRQIVQNCRALLNGPRLKEISLKVPWGDVKGIEVGPADAPPVLMLHGWLDNCYSFVPLLTKLPHNRRYIALDLPGHGHSSHKPKSCSNFLLNWVTDIECIRRALEVDKFSMVGHSLGGIISLIYSATYPDCIDKTVTIDAIYPSLSEPEEVVAKLRKSVDDHVNDTFVQKDYKDVKTLAEVKSDSIWYQGLDCSLTELIAERGSVCSEAGVRQTYDPTMRYSSLMYLSKAHFAVFLKALKQPVLFIGGDEGAVRFFKGDPNEVFAINKVISSKMLHGPHHVHMSAPEITADTIDFFLKQDTPVHTHGANSYPTGSQ